MIEISRVTAFQQNTQVFEDFSLTIERGERVAILGPNGAGKSTLLKLISREIYPVDKPESSVRLFGNETMTIWDLRSRIGFVSQDLQEDYTPYTSALDVVVSGFFGAIGTHERFQPSAEQIEQARTAMQALGISGDERRMFQRLSTGQKRRLLLARALVHKPEALILDEPASGLDMGASTAMLALVREFCGQNRSLVITTHHIDEIIPEIDRVVLLKNGRLQADGPKRDILTSERLSDLYDVGLHVTERNGWYRCWQAE